MKSSDLMKDLLNAFLTGKHYTHAKRIHVLVATAMGSKHIDLFLQVVEANDSYGDVFGGDK